MKYTKEELQHLLDELKESVKTRSKVNSTHPNVSKLPSHTKRLNEELNLIRDLTNYLHGK